VTAVTVTLGRVAGPAGAIGVLVAGLAGFAALTALVVATDGPALDDRGPRAADAIYEHDVASRATETLLYASIVLGALAALAALVILVALGQRRQAVFWAFAIGGVLVLERLLKALVDRPGIGAAQDEHSFPSGNAMASVALVAAAALLLRAGRARRLVVILGAVAILVEGIALVVAGWHYPTDVLAGWCAAASWVAVLWLALAPVPLDRVRGA
jgi:membrane-associated phospholipid phosphatase